MKNRRKFAARSLAATVVVACTAAGCGTHDRVATHPVHGQVLVRGEPAAGAFVTFHPQATQGESSFLVPRAVTDDGGWFSPTTYVAGDGAPAGRFRVTVSWRKAPATGDSEEMHPDEASRSRELVSPRFTQLETTPLVVTIVAGDNALPAWDVD
jgi:hypothetical protein